MWKNVKTGLVSTYLSDSGIMRVLDISEISSILVFISLRWDNISLKLRTLFRWGEGKAVEWSSGPSDKVNFTIPSQHLDCWMKKLKILSFLRNHFLEHLFKIPLRIWSRGEREGQVWVDPAALRLHARYRAPNRYVCIRACIVPIWVNKSICLNV